MTASPSDQKSPDLVRVRAALRGAVQGVGFRPFVYRLAAEMGLAGWVSNTSQGLFLEAEGAKEQLDRFILRLENEKPPRSSVQSFEFSFLDPVGYSGFVIKESDHGGEKSVLVLPDIATCPECLADILDPNNRRYQYPFTNCTNCGPRFSIIESLPYDRPNTSMKSFAMCAACRKEYEDPADRRFHAQPTACPTCGPRLYFLTEAGVVKHDGHRALTAAAQAIRDGFIVAVKGLGGFHLMVDARSDEAVKRLRERKHREEKPLAMMFPSLAMAQEECVVSDLEARSLQSPEAPIVLLLRKDNRELYGTMVSSLGIAASVAPGNPTFGVMLPYTPLHHLLMRELRHPIVATSGNLSDEPICTNEREAVRRLGGIADFYLVHDRPIVRHVDDSVIRVMLGKEMVLRRARGYAPLPIPLPLVSPGSTSSKVLALGAHLKNTVALSVGANVFVSQHIGDLETQQSLDAFRAVGRDFQRLYDVRPDAVACDMHPDYVSSKSARSDFEKVVEIQHHHAHVLACMAEHELSGEVLGVSWDGTGYGPDGTVWGGEFLLTEGAGFRRFARFRTFRLPGGDKAVKEPRRTAAGLLFELLGEEPFRERMLAPLKELSVAELSIILQMLRQHVNAPETSSVGRLFDAVASLVNARHYNSYEGQAAMELEFALAGESSEQRYRCEIVRVSPESEREGIPLLVDWSPMIRDILADIKKCVQVPLISKKFHNALVQALVDVAVAAGREKVVLSGGCFQNKYLTERAVAKLQTAGFRPYWHQRIPPNDGGISLGQVYGALLAARSV